MAAYLGDGERESFRDLLWKLLEAHDAEIAALKERFGSSGSKQEEPDATAIQEQEYHAPSLLQDFAWEQSETLEQQALSREGKEEPHEPVVQEIPPDNGEPQRTSTDDEPQRTSLVDFNKSASLRSSRSSRASKHGSHPMKKTLRRTKSTLSETTVLEPTEYLHYNLYQLLWYWIDTWISRRRSQGFALAILVLVADIVFGALWTLCFYRSGLSWYENLLDGFWLAWTYMADPGTHASVVDNNPSVIDTQPERFLSAIIAAAGIVFMGATLGMIVDVIREKMESLRQGKSNVVETGHSLILGWTEKAVSIIEELCFANESAGGGKIVVLSSIPKEEIERDFAFQFPNPYRGTRVVFRTGNPMIVNDLMKVGAPTARATIILSNDGDPDNSDAETLRVVLSLKTLKYKLEGHVVAEVRDIDNEPLVKMVGGDVVESLVSHDILGRLMLTSARQPGLAKVYEALLGFRGDEFYMSEWPELVGVPFGGLIERFPDAVPIGIFTAGLQLILNPQADRKMLEGESILVIAEDDDTYKPEAPASVEEGNPPTIKKKDGKPEKILFCGWRRDIRDIVQHLDDTLQEGSEIHMITGHLPIAKRREVLMDEGLDVDGLKRTTLVQHYGNPSVRRKLAALPLAEFTSCMIFADQAYETDTMQADSHSLATLLLLRDLQLQHVAKERPLNPLANKASRRVTGHGLTISDTKSLANSLDPVVQSCPVICEILDPRTQKTIMGNQYLRHSSDFCQTNKITAQLIAMVAENRSVNVLFDELLGVQGNGVNVVPSSRFTDGEESIPFWTIAKRASTMNETVIGYADQRCSHVRINPRKGAYEGKSKDEPMQWEGYVMIVIQRDEGEEIHDREFLKPYVAEKGKIDILSLLEETVKGLDQPDCIRIVDALRHVHKMSTSRNENLASCATSNRKLNDVVM